MNYTEEYIQVIITEIYQLGEFRDKLVKVKVSKEITSTDIHDFISSLGYNNFGEFYRSNQAVHSEPEDIENEIDFISMKLSYDFTTDAVEAIKGECDHYKRFRNFIIEKYRNEVIKKFKEKLDNMEIEL